MNSTIKFIILMVVIISFIVPVVLIDKYAQKKDGFTDCYDKNNHLIVGVECKYENQIVWPWNIISQTLCLVAPIIIILTVFWLVCID